VVSKKNKFFIKVIRIADGINFVCDKNNFLNIEAITKYEIIGAVVSVRYV